MKNILFLFLLASLFGCFGRPPSIKTGLEGKPMPSFNLLLMDSATILNTDNIPYGEPIVLFFFNPHCPYCKAQTEDLITNVTLFPHIRFYFLSNFQFTQLKAYYDHYQLKKYANIIVGQDYNAYFRNYYKPAGVPFIAIYSWDKKLKQVLLGNTESKLLKEIAIK